MKIFNYQCEWCGAAGQIEIKDADNDVADLAIKKMLNIKKCDPCAELGAAQSDEFDRRRVLLDAAMRFSDNKHHMERIETQMRVVKRSLAFLSQKIEERQSAKLIKPEKVRVDTVPKDRLPF